MDMIIDFPGGAKVDAHFGPFTVTTDQQDRGVQFENALSD